MGRGATTGRRIQSPGKHRALGGAPVCLDLRRFCTPYSWGEWGEFPPVHPQSSKVRRTFPKCPQSKGFHHNDRVRLWLNVPSWFPPATPALCPPRLWALRGMSFCTVAHKLRGRSCPHALGTASPKQQGADRQLIKTNPGHKRIVLQTCPRLGKSGAWGSVF